MIKFSHTLFALPFALMGMMLAAGGMPEWPVVAWVLAAMVGARSGAMGFNRLVDRHYDALNPRTASREIPQGLIGVRETALFVLASFALLVLAAWQLNPLCLWLSPVAIALVCFYSYTKRFTSLSHLVLGLAISAAPVGAWIAVSGSAALPAFVLAGIVMCWIAGFDILYALQDYEFDHSQPLHSLPKRLGKPGAILVSRVLHALMFILLVLLGMLVPLGGTYAAGVLVAGLLLVRQHRLVGPNDLSRLDLAFFNTNAWISVELFALTAVDLLWL